MCAPVLCDSSGKESIGYKALRIPENDNRNRPPRSSPAWLLEGTHICLDLPPKPWEMEGVVPPQGRNRGSDSIFSFHTSISHSWLTLLERLHVSCNTATNPCRNDGAHNSTNHAPIFKSPRYNCLTQQCSQGLLCSRKSCIDSIKCLWLKTSYMVRLVLDDFGFLYFISLGLFGMIRPAYLWVMLGQIVSQNHRMVCVGRVLKSHLVRIPLPQSGLSINISGCQGNVGRQS